METSLQADWRTAGPRSQSARAIREGRQAISRLQGELRKLAVDRATVTGDPVLAQRTTREYPPPRPAPSGCTHSFEGHNARLLF